MARIAITGGIACGKSTVSCVIARFGAAVLDADDVVHRLQRSGEVGFQRIVDWLGEAVVAEGGELDRERVAELVFADPEKRRELNSLIHPLVRSACDAWLAEKGDRVIVVPLLFEAGWDMQLDAIICVACDERKQVARLCKRGMSEEMAHQRIRAQMALSEKMARADFVIVNSGTLDELEDETRRVWAVIMEMIHGGK